MMMVGIRGHEGIDFQAGVKGREDVKKYMCVWKRGTYVNARSPKYMQ